MTEKLKICNLNTLKRVCKLLRIKNYSGLKKNDIIFNINKHHATIRIQRWIRNILSKGELCPISCEPIKYPCFAFNTPNNVLIYYNLDALRNFLIKSGDFRDPNTRTEYTDKQLLEMDNIHKYYIKNEPKQEPESTVTKEYFKTVFKASKSRRFYEKMKEKEQEQLIFERILDSICEDMLRLINENFFNIFTLDTIETMHLYDYRTQFRRLLNRSKNHAEYVINKNIENINQISSKENYNQNQLRISEYIILFLYQLREELWLIG